ncbi:cytochrome d ubiquinol oxidase subunit II [Catellatospora coxensis]|uniref:Cytochrome c oxidase assembly protein n=1 Tax=Catellatospora coxensis TaxID=310354 RepID=A0A8J3KKT0_9ACTN|nr:cytochrome d ubiquinol oxidase subunit II [Catellatospora coxensis]GIG04827.1 cytochrome c oxidase assembly protein [Catellatospora coxensis]
MSLADLWFIAVAVLWTGFFILEGFDFGVGMLHGVVGRDDAGRRMAVSSIGPLWDGNEVWLVVAGAAMFAAFPGWYATMFSSLYLALVLVLAALIVRGMSFEYRDKDKHPRWRRTWSTLLTVGSVVAPFLLGVGLGDLLHGLPIGADQEFAGTFADLLPPYSLFVGLTFVLLCALHGATFLALKTTADVRERATRLTRRLAPVTALAVLVYITWSHVISGKGFFPNVIEIAAVLAVLAAAWLAGDGKEGWAFTATTFAMATSVLVIFTNLYPRVMVSTMGAANDLTLANTASGSYALKVMTVVLVVMLPVVILYQAWTYHVFRQRVTAADVTDD